MIYFLTAACCLFFARHAPRAFWWVIVCILVLIGIGSLTNLPRYITTFGRNIAYDYGWYRVRRPFQTLGIVGVLLASMFFVVRMRSQFQRLRAPEWLALLAMGALFNLIIVRAISLHYVDSLFRKQVFDLRIDKFLELLILLCIIATSLWAGRRKHATREQLNK
jgi:hypothetical protein